jgi:hypothetical protein
MYQINIQKSLTLPVSILLLYEATLVFKYTLFEMRI